VSGVQTPRKYDGQVPRTQSKSKTAIILDRWAVEYLPAVGWYV